MKSHERGVRRSWVRRTRKDWLGHWWAECREDGCRDGRRVLRIPATGPEHAERLMDHHRELHRQRREDS